MHDAAGEPAPQLPLEQVSEPRARMPQIARIGLGLGASMLGAGIVVAPTAVEHGIDTARVDTQIGQVPATIRITTNGQSSLRTGLTGNYYSPISYGKLGMSVRAEGAPQVQNVSTLFSEQSLRTYAGFSDGMDSTLEQYEQALVTDARHEMIKHEARWAVPIGIGSYAILMFAGGFKHRTRGQVATGLIIATTAAVSVSGYNAYTNFNERADREPVATVKYPITALDGTPLQGAYADSPLANFVLNDAVGYVERLTKQQKEQGEAFTDNMEASLAESVELMAGPRSNERAFVVTSDMHSNRYATKFLQANVEAYKSRFGEDAIAFAIDAGDRQYNTKMPIEAKSQERLRQALGNTPYYVINGNHDPVDAGRSAEAAGLTPIENKTINADGTSILGVNDVQHTPFVGASVLKKDWTETRLGEAAQEIAEVTNPDITVMHQGAAVQSFLGVDSLRSFMDSNEVPLNDVPTKAVFFGHWHEEQEPRIVANDDGTWTVIFELGTVGGANESTTPGSISLPNEVPKKTASYFTVFQDDETGLITGYQRISVAPDGTETISERVDTGPRSNRPGEGLAVKRLKP